jgi:hypothetical protein
MTLVFLPPLPAEPSATMTWRNRLHPGGLWQRLVLPAGTDVVAHQLAAAAGKN